MRFWVISPDSCSNVYKFPLILIITKLNSNGSFDRGESPGTDADVCKFPRSEIFEKTVKMGKNWHIWLFPSDLKIKVSHVWLGVRGDNSNSTHILLLYAQTKKRSGVNKIVPQLNPIWNLSTKCRFTYTFFSVHKWPVVNIKMKVASFSNQCYVKHWPQIYYFLLSKDVVWETTNYSEFDGQIS